MSLATPSLCLRGLQRLRGPVAGVACDSGKRSQVKALVPLPPTAAHPMSSDSYQHSDLSFSLLCKQLEPKPVGEKTQGNCLCLPALHFLVQLCMRLLWLKQQLRTVTQVSQGPPSSSLCSPLSLSASQLEVTLKILPGLLTCFE